jgi:dTDP-glucose 4,6-dehydratase
METKKILVTGALGAVGSPLVASLRRRGHDVWMLDRTHHYDNRYFRCDVGEYRQIERVMEEESFDFIYHLAAEFGRNNGEDFFETLWRTNAVGTKNMLRLQERKKFRMIFTSSSEVYGDYRGAMEESVLYKFPTRQLNDYAMTKWVNEMQIMNSRDRFGTETVILRLFNTYGPGEYYSDYRSVVCLFIYRAMHSIPYKVYLSNHRSSSYVDDTVATMTRVVDKFKPGEVYNIASDEYHTIKKISDIILDQLGEDDSIVTYEKEEPHNTLNKKADISKAKRDLAHKLTVDLNEGIRRTIEWQRKVYGKS